MISKVLNLLLMVCAALVLVGCGKSTPYPMAPAKGIVKFEDGSIPQGEVMIIRFEPNLPPGGGTGPRPSPASGEINPQDGSFEMMIGRGNLAGAPVGEHKVTFTIIDDYANPKSLIPEDYNKSSTTPITATVPAGGKTDFEFVIKRK